MGYQVLARKWRPANFEQMVGQEHVLTALINSLDQGRLHHAYLFTGTRGVGKTTVARIFAKALNCEQGVSAHPCGECSACVEISEGRFVDLIEVDAASRTKVEDTRELLENVQYAPARGRFKIYLIDEVHMLSGHSFNALLKTLEEPPEHVKFLLATTDPQQLPITILSRCLQFSLKAMTPEAIVGHLQNVLQQEAVPFDEAALWLLGREAAGSMRDALSLTDQAISYGNGELRTEQVRAMLGSIDHDQVFGLVEQLAANDASALLQQVAKLATHSPDYNDILAGLISLLHRMAVAQLAPDAVDNGDGDRAQVLALSEKFSAQQLQLMYQTALLGRRDLPLAPQARSGFEMTLLRIMLFKPQGLSGATGGSGTARQPAVADGSSASAANPEKKTDPQPEFETRRESEPVSAASVKTQTAQPPAVQTEPVKPEPIRPEPIRPEPPQPPPAATPKPSPQQTAAGYPNIPPPSDEWYLLVQGLALLGPVGNLVRNCVLASKSEDQWLFHLNPRYETLLKPDYPDQLSAALSAHFGQPIRATIAVAASDKPTPDQLAAAYRQELHQAAVELMESDPFVRELRDQMGARLDPNSVTPVTEPSNS